MMASEFGTQYRGDCFFLGFGPINKGLPNQENSRKRLTISVGFTHQRLVPSGEQIRGLILEEIILRALEVAGYDTLLHPDGTRVRHCPAGLELQGRGSWHQIDAIADYRIQSPFSHPQRLLVEAKCCIGGVGLEVIRNAIGVHKDLSEFWTSSHLKEHRFHYQYAVFSATHFTAEAESYAFAQDVYLFPLGHSRFFQPILKAIWRAKTRKLESNLRKTTYTLKDVRLAFRNALRGGPNGRSKLDNILRAANATATFDNILFQASKLKGVLFASSRTGFLVLLVPDPDAENLDQIISGADEHIVRIHVEKKKRARFWYLTTTSGKKLFTLDIPPKLFQLHVGEGQLDRLTMANIKQIEFPSFQAPYRIDDRFGIARFKLDTDWIETVLSELNI